MNRHMELWDWDDAPSDLRALSEHGGNEDGILVVPVGKKVPYWMDRVWCTLPRDPQVVTLGDGRRAYIWAHS